MSLPLGFTRHCLQSVCRHTRLAFELIVVDNRSTDGTGAYLAGVADAARVPVTVIANRTNQGFPAGINQGLRAARGGYLVLLNHDVVVTDVWLDQLVGLAEMIMTTEGNAKPTTKGTKYTKDENGTEGRLGIGLVGPMSNW
jgi:GT2 family glycosyltransferase